jgi:hypothetical protein
MHAAHAPPPPHPAPRRTLLLAAGSLPSGALIGGALAAAGVVAAALAGGAGAKDGRQLVRDGMAKFKANDIEARGRRPRGPGGRRGPLPRANAARAAAALLSPSAS